MEEEKEMKTNEVNKKDPCTTISHKENILKLVQLLKLIINQILCKNECNTCMHIIFQQCSLRRVSKTTVTSPPPYLILNVITSHEN